MSSGIVFSLCLLATVAIAYLYIHNYADLYNKEFTNNPQPPKSRLKLVWGPLFLHNVNVNMSIFFFSIHVFFPSDARRPVTHASGSEQAAGAGGADERRRGELPPPGGGLARRAAALLAAAPGQAHRPGAPGQGGHAAQQPLEQRVQPAR